MKYNLLFQKNSWCSPSTTVFAGSFLQPVLIYLSSKLQCLCSDPINLSGNDGCSLVLQRCCFYLTVLLFMSILVCLHLHQFTSASVFSLRCSFLQLCEVIIIDTPLQYFPKSPVKLSIRLEEVEDGKNRRKACKSPCCQELPVLTNQQGEYSHYVEEDIQVLCSLFKPATNRQVDG